MIERGLCFLRFGAGVSGVNAVAWGKVGGGGGEGGERQMGCEGWCVLSSGTFGAGMGRRGMVCLGLFACCVQVVKCRYGR